MILVLLPKPQIPRSNVVSVARKSFDSGMLRWNSSVRRNILVGIGRAFHREQRNGRWSEKWFVPDLRDQKFYRVTLLDRRWAYRVVEFLADSSDFIRDGTIVRFVSGERAGTYASFQTSVGDKWTIIVCALSLRWRTMRGLMNALTQTASTLPACRENVDRRAPSSQPHKFASPVNDFLRSSHRNGKET